MWLPAPCRHIVGATHRVAQGEAVPRPYMGSHKGCPYKAVRSCAAVPQHGRGGPKQVSAIRLNEDPDRLKAGLQTGASSFVVPPSGGLGATLNDAESLKAIWCGLRIPLEAEAALRVGRRLLAWRP